MHRTRYVYGKLVRDLRELKKNIEVCVRVRFDKPN